MAYAFPGFQTRSVSEPSRFHGSASSSLSSNAPTRATPERVFSLRMKPIGLCPGLSSSSNGNHLLSQKKTILEVFGGILLIGVSGNMKMNRRNATVASMATEKPKKRYPGEAKGFVEEMRFVAMRLHTPDQAKEGKKVADTQPIAKWEPTIEGYLKFLVDSKFVYDTLERIVQESPCSSYAEFRSTGLERSEKLAKDLEWFMDQGHTIPEPSAPGTSYAAYLHELSEKDPQAFICHFYNTYFAHSAGGRMIGKKVAETILENKELEFYKWDGDLPTMLQNVRDKINKIAEGWTREEKDHCLAETEKSFKYSGEILRLILS